MSRAVGLLFFLVPLQETRAPLDEPWTWRGQVRDAFTGAPLGEARCELWTEDLYAHPELVAEASSGDDGAFALADAARRGRKLVLRRAGYRSTEVGTPEAEAWLFPATHSDEWHLVDLDGRPIPGALLQTRQSCRHALPAVEATSDALGRVLVPDLPPFADGGEVEVLARGYGAIGMLDTLDAVGCQVIALPPRRGITLRALAPDGRPIAGGRLRYQGESGGGPLVPDPEGWVSVDPLFEGPSGLLFWRRDERHEAVRQLEDLPSEGRWAVRFGEPPPEILVAQLLLVADLPAELARAANVRILHEAGWLFRGAGEHEVPAGVLHVVVGAPFSGVREEVERLELSAGESARRTIAALPEPVLRLRVPEGTWSVHVQAGEDSITTSPEDEEPLEIPVPPGRLVTVVAQGAAIRTARLAPWSGTRALDLGAPDVLAVEIVELRFLVRSETGSQVTVAGRALGAGSDWPDEDPDGARVLFRLPRGTRWEASFQAEGHHTLHRAGIARASSRSAAEIALPPLPR